MKLSLVTEDFWQGTLREDDNGKEVNVLFDLVQPDALYQYVLEQFRR